MSPCVESAQRQGARRGADEREALAPGHVVAVVVHRIPASLEKKRVRADHRLGRPLPDFGIAVDIQLVGGVVALVHGLDLYGVRFEHGRPEAALDQSRACARGRRRGFQP